jgi:hypothetical protein
MATHTNYSELSPVTGRATTVALYAATIFHGFLGVLWCLLVLCATSIRDCLITCDPVTNAEAHAAATVWVLGGLTWAALLAFLLTSAGSRRVFLGLSLVPVWFVIAAAWGVTTILESVE